MIVTHADSVRAIIVMAIFTIQRVIPPQRRGEARQAEGRAKPAASGMYVTWRHVTLRGFTLALARVAPRRRSPSSARRSRARISRFRAIAPIPSRGSDGPLRRDVDLCAHEISQLTRRHAIGSMRHLKSRPCRGRNVGTGTADVAERERPDARAQPRQLQRKPPPNPRPRGCTPATLAHCSELN